MHFINPEECAIPLFPHDSGRHRRLARVGVPLIEREVAEHVAHLARVNVMLLDG